jgi:hypothetical protein
VNANKGLVEVLHHLAERNRQGGAPADQHVVMAWTQWLSPGSRREPDDFAQTAADAVSLHGVADLPRYSEADSDSVISRALPRLKHESAAGGAYAIGRGSKIAAAFQPLNDGRTGILLTH